MSSIWDVVPTMSFGSLSKWYFTLSDRSTRQDVANVYGIDEVVLRSVLRYLMSVRNICAHHERIWNANIGPGLKIPREVGGSRELAMASNQSGPGKTHNALVIMVHLMEVITPNGRWAERLIAFMETGNYQSVPRWNMGFQVKWRDSDIWRRHLPQSGGD